MCQSNCFVFVGLSSQHLEVLADTFCRSPELCKLRLGEEGARAVDDSVELYGVREQQVDRHMDLVGGVGQVGVREYFGERQGLPGVCGLDGGAV